MKMTHPTFIMTTICLNFSFDHLKEKLPEHSQLQLYQCSFLGFKLGYAPDLKIRKSNLGQTLMAINYTIEQLFAVAYGLGTPIKEEKTIIDVTERIKLQKIRCYKLFVPIQQTTNFYSIMQQNLKLEFPDYKIRIEPVDSEKYMIITDTA